MNNNVLDSLRNDYVNKIEERDRKERYTLKLITLQNFLDKHPHLFKNVSFRDKIKDFLNSYKKDEEILNDLIEEAVNYHLLDDNNEILFYAGAFMNDGETLWQVPRYSEKAEYDLYLNIENGERTENPVTNRLDFEKDKKIIFFLKTYPTILDFKDLRYDFFMNSISNDQEAACKRVLDRKF